MMSIDIIRKKTTASVHECYDVFIIGLPDCPLACSEEPLATRAPAASTGAVSATWIC